MKEFVLCILVTQDCIAIKCCCKSVIRGDSIDGVVVVEEVDSVCLHSFTANCIKSTPVTNDANGCVKEIERSVG